MATTKNEMLDALLQRMDDALANGLRLPWQKPWEPQFGDLSAPHNPTTERLYSPLNGLILSTAALEHGYEDPRWMGFNQAKEQGWSVRRGEHAAARIFSPIIKNEINPRTGLEEPRVVAYRGTPLFNAAQIDGIPPMREIPEHERLPKTAELDAIAQQMGVSILHSGNGAFYSPSRDRIQLPDRNTFADQHGYDATKAHELSHATGHESRLDRDSLRQYTSIKGRAAEEMTAEIGAYLLSTRLGVPFMGNNPDMTDAQHAAYLTTWARDLSPDERRAAIEQGIKAAGHLEKQIGLARENGLVQEMEKQAVEIAQDKDVILRPDLLGQFHDQQMVKDMREMPRSDLPEFYRYTASRMANLEDAQEIVITHGIHGNPDNPLAPKVGVGDKAAIQKYREDFIGKITPRLEDAALLEVVLRDNGFTPENPGNVDRSIGVPLTDGHFLVQNAVEHKDAFVKRLDDMIGPQVTAETLTLNTPVYFARKDRTAGKVLDERTPGVVSNVARDGSIIVHARIPGAEIGADDGGKRSVDIVDDVSGMPVAQVRAYALREKDLTLRNERIPGLDNNPLCKAPYPNAEWTTVADLRKTREMAAKSRHVGRDAGIER